MRVTCGPKKANIRKKMSIKGKSRNASMDTICWQILIMAVEQTAWQTDHLSLEYQFSNYFV